MDCRRGEAGDSVAEHCGTDPLQNVATADGALQHIRIAASLGLEHSTINVSYRPGTSAGLRYGGGCPIWFPLLYSMLLLELLLQVVPLARMLRAGDNGHQTRQPLW